MNYINVVYTGAEEITVQGGDNQWLRIAEEGVELGNGRLIVNANTNFQRLHPFRLVKIAFIGAWMRKIGEIRCQSFESGGGLLFTVKDEDGWLFKIENHETDTYTIGVNRHLPNRGNWVQVAEMVYTIAVNDGLSLTETNRVMVYPPNIGRINVPVEFVAEIMDMLTTIATHGMSVASATQGIVIKSGATPVCVPESKCEMYQDYIDCILLDGISDGAEAKIPLIKRLRELSGVGPGGYTRAGLKECKDIIDDFISRNPGKIR
jgi:ribosomal protein L7/L12